jgi:Domain of unknown function (DUF4158)
VPLAASPLPRGREREPQEAPPEGHHHHHADEEPVGLGGVAEGQGQGVNNEGQAIEEYARERDPTRREHLHELQQTFGFRPFDARVYRELAAWLLPTALGTDAGVGLVAALLDELRARRIVAPALSTVERLGWETRRRAQRLVCARLTAGLTAAQRQALDALLVTPPEQRAPRAPVPTRAPPRVRTGWVVLPLRLAGPGRRTSLQEAGPRRRGGRARGAGPVAAAPPAGSRGRAG